MQIHVTFQYNMEMVCIIHHETCIFMCEIFIYIYTNKYDS